MTITTDQKVLETVRRIDERIRTLGTNRTKVERDAGLYRGMINQMVTGKALRPSGENMLLLAKQLRCDVEYLTGDQTEIIRGAGTAEPTPSSGIPLRGLVEAGRFMEFEEFDDSVGEIVEGPRHARFPNARHYAWTVQGDSMNKAGLAPGDVVLGVLWEDTGLRLINEMTVVAERSRNNGMMRELTVKEVEVTSDGYVLHPRSTNATHKPFFLPKTFEDDGTEVRVVAMVYSVVKKVGPI